MLSEYNLGRLDAYAEMLSMAQLMGSNPHKSIGVRSAWQKLADALELRIRQESAAVADGQSSANTEEDSISNVEFVTDEEEESVLASLEEIKRVVRLEGLVSLASHRRRCCLQAGVREWTEIECEQHDWDEVKEWCRTCGTTRGDLLGGSFDDRA